MHLAMPVAARPRRCGGGGGRDTTRQRGELVWRRERERRRGRERERDTDTQTHRHTDTQTHRHTDTHTNLSGLCTTCVFECDAVKLNACATDTVSLCAALFP